MFLELLISGPLSLPKIVLCILVHILHIGVITMDEIQALEEVSTPHGKWWVPVVWSCNLVKQSRKEARIADDYSMKTILDVSKNLVIYWWKIVNCFKEQLHFIM